MRLVITQTFTPTAPPKRMNIFDMLIRSLEASSKEGAGGRP